MQNQASFLEGVTPKLSAAVCYIDKPPIPHLNPNKNPKLRPHHRLNHLFLVPFFVVVLQKCLAGLFYSFADVEGDVIRIIPNLPQNLQLFLLRRIAEFHVFIQNLPS